MKRTGFFLLGMIISAVLAQPAQAQANDAADSSRTIWDGVYTLDQADRGKETAAINCSACHSPAEWGSPAFMTRWSGGSVAYLHAHIRDNMPYDAPGRLTAEEYADIIAYMLYLNNVPTGEQELSSKTAELDEIQFTPQPAQARAQ